MTTQATASYGLSFTFGGTAMPEGFTLDGPDTQRDMIDVTNFASPGAFKEYIGGLIDGGMVSLSGNYLPQSTVVKAFQAALIAVPQLAIACTVVFTDSGASVCSFNALPKSFKSKGAVADKLSADFGAQITGIVTYPT